MWQVAKLQANLFFMFAPFTYQTCGTAVIFLDEFLGEEVTRNIQVHPAPAKARIVSDSEARQNRGGLLRTWVGLKEQLLQSLHTIEKAHFLPRRQSDLFG